MMTVCEVCGDLGCKELLLPCKNCNGTAVHRYCLDKVDFDGTVIDWSCYECHPGHGKITNERSLEVSQDDRTVVGRQSEENHGAASSLDAEHDKPGMHGGSDDYVNDILTLKRNKERFQLHDKANNDLQQKSLSANVAQPSTLHEDSVALTISSSANTDGLPKDSNCVPSAHTEIGNPRGSSVRLVLTGGNPSEPSMLLDGAYSGSLPKDSSEEKIVREASSSVPSDAVGNFCKDNPRKRRKLVLLDDDDDDEEVEPSNTIQNVVKDNPRKRRKLILPDDDVEVERPNTVQNIVKDNPMKRRKLILPDDDVEVEVSNAVQNIVKDDPRKPIEIILLDDNEQDDAENLNSLSLECEGPIEKHRIDTGYGKESVQAGTGGLKGQSFKNDRPVKEQRCLEDAEQDVPLDGLVPQSLENTCPTKKRRFVCPSDDEQGEVIKGSMIAECALNDVANMASQLVDAKDHHLQSRMTFASDFTKHQYYIYSQPMGEPVWSGTFMTDSNVSIMLAAHLSTKACQRVLEFARSLRPVVEVIKLPRLKVWPKSWGKSGPTDESIGLFFLPRSMRPNEELDTLVKEVIESDAVLKAVLGTVELLIFPSILLPEQYHEFQGKYYLWGVCKARKYNPGTAILVEQNGLACASEEGEVQEHEILDQQYEVQSESSDEESFVVRHVGDQLPADCNHEAQKRDTKTALGESSVSPDSCLSSNKPSPAKAGSHCFMEPRVDHKPSEHGVADQQEEQDFTSLPRWNDRNVTSPPSDSLPSANRLFGFVTARSERCQQLIQEMVKEGAFLFRVPEEMTITGSTIGKSNGVGVAQAPDDGCQHMQEHCKPIEFVPIDHHDPNEASEACLELFPVQQEQIGLTPGIDVKEVELDLSLGASRRAPSELP